jgi:Zn-dependent peptidase ImmA (M78 family)
MPVTVFGARVRQARVLRRQTSTAVWNEMGWSAARQTRLEQSQVSELSEVEHQLLARVLRFPAHFFTTEPGSIAGQLLFRAPKATTLSEKEYLAQFSAAVGDYADLLDGHHKLPAVRLPSKVRASDGLALAAARAREALHLAPGQPIGYLTHELERAGVVVVVRPDRARGHDGEIGEQRPEKHLGSSCWTGSFRDRPLIVLRRIDSWERVRWTLAHELAHLVLHADAAGEINETMEAEANEFASEFLAPADVIAGELPRHVTLQHLLSVKLKWGVSIGALVKHLHTAGVIDDLRLQMLQTQLYTRRNPETGTTWGRTEPGWDARSPELPRMLSRWTDRTYSTTSPAALASLGLIWPRDVLEEMLLEQRTAPTTATAAALAAKLPSMAASSVIDLAQARAAKRA